MSKEVKCPRCNHPKPERGRAFDGRRAYRCPRCDNQWTMGLQGRQQKFNPQVDTNQFPITKRKEK